MYCCGNDAHQCHDRKTATSCNVSRISVRMPSRDCRSLLFDQVTKQWREQHFFTHLSDLFQFRQKVLLRQSLFACTNTCQIKFMKRNLFLSSRWCLTFALIVSLLDVLFKSQKQLARGLATTEVHWRLRTLIRSMPDQTRSLVDMLWTHLPSGRGVATGCRSSSYTYVWIRDLECTNLVLTVVEDCWNFEVCTESRS